MLTPKIKNHDWTSVRQAISKLYTKLGPVSRPTFAGLTLTDMIQGSAIFAGPGGLISQDNDNYFWDDVNNRLGIGTNTPERALHLVGQTFLQEIEGTFTNNQQTCYRDSALSNNFIFAHARNTKASPSASVDGDRVMNFEWRGWTGAVSEWETAGAITGYIDGTPVDETSMPGRLQFWTTLVGSLTPSIRMTIKNDGKVGIGLIAPKTLLTVEGTVTLKEQAAADSDTAAYSQIWAKTASPSELWHTDDTGVDTQIAPQDLRTSASPTFAGLDVNGTTETDRLLVG